ncbi:MAG: PQQ-binding-like beta-propeller repeat protein, partial [Planctomycetota bacterium]
KSQTSITRSGRDLQTGEVKQTVTVANLISPMHHYRCYRSKGTENFLMLGKRGIEFLDLEGDDHMRHDWLRAPCSYGFIPANGLLYMPPSTCFCYPGVKLNGFNALAAKESVAPEVPGEARLLRGPAYGEAVAGADTHRADWPTYRSDIARSGRAKTALTAQFRVEWQEPLEGKASPPVIADGQLYVALIDQHAVCCIDAATGERRWMFTAGGRVDSPPTVWRDRVLFGSTDGYVYCVRASDGALAWRFLAAPHDRRLVSWDQVESVWPVHGSVVVLDDPERGTDAATVYCTAGRSSFLDGGLSLWSLDVATGQSLHFTRYASRRPNVQSEEGQPFDMEGARSDVLTSDGTYLFLFQDVFDRELKPIEAPRLTTLGDRRTPSHLMTTGGFLDDSWWDRTYWTYGNRWPGFYFANEGSKAGQIIVFDEAHTFGLHVFRNRLRLSPGFTPGEGYELFADDNDNELYLAENSADREKGPGYSRLKPPVWSTEIPVRARAMVLADAAENTGARAAGGRILFLAGPPDVVDPRDPLAAFEGRKGAVMWAVSAADGSKLAEYKLESEPIFNGMAAADGRLYLVDREGQLICFAGRN